MTFVEVLTEGTSDVPIVKEILVRRFGLSENIDFRIHPHRGKGRLPVNPLAKPSDLHRGLLDQLPAKLRGFGKYMNEHQLVLVLVDADNDDSEKLIQALNALLVQLPSRPPRVLFRVAVEETESWFLADTKAIRAAYPHARLAAIQSIAPDAIVGAWERFAECIGHRSGAGPDKTNWAIKIAPHLNLEEPFSPSLKNLLSGLHDELNSGQV